MKALGLGPWCDVFADEVTEDTHGVSESWATVVTGEELEGLTYNEEVACALEVLCSWDDGTGEPNSATEDIGSSDKLKSVAMDLDSDEAEHHLLGYQR